MQILIFVCVLTITTLGFSHELNGFKHESHIGPAIGAAHCGYGIDIWWLDRDEDGVIDGCALLIFSHDKFHVKEIPMIDGKCKCP